MSNSRGNKAAILAGVTFTAFSAQAAQETTLEAGEYNILWLFAEDISPWMPAWGDKTVETPNIDFLIENGVQYTNCYATAGVSSASRSAIMTGVMQTTAGVHNHRTGRTEALPHNLPDNIEVLPEMMREAGYHTFNNGKDDFNWSYDWNDYWTGSFTQQRFFGKVGKGSWRDREEGQLFFGVVELYGGKNKISDVEPIDPSSVVVPPYYPNLPFMQEALAKHYNQIKQTDYEIGQYLKRLKEDGLLESTIIIFLSDNGYQTLRDKQFLYDGGIHMPFVVSAPGNHALIEQLGAKCGEVRDDLMTLMDINATTLAMADIEIPDYMESKNIFEKGYKHEYVVAARDRCDFTIDRIRAIRTKKFKYLRNFMTDRPLMQPQYRDKSPHYKEFIKIYESGTVKFADEWLNKTRPAEELYDVVNDPYEINNLADDPKYKRELKTMRKRLDEWIKETKDQGAYPESKEQLEVLIERWGDRCVNPEYDAVKNAN